MLNLVLVAGGFITSAGVLMAADFDAWKTIAATVLFCSLTLNYWTIILALFNCGLMLRTLPAP